jgi:hypothetical protein
LCKSKKEKSRKNNQNDKIVNVAGTGLSKIKHLHMKIDGILKFRNIRRSVHTAVIMEPSMCHFRVIPSKAAYGPKNKESVCP